MKKFQHISGIPIFIADLEWYASEAYYLYTQIITNHLRLKSDIEKQSMESNARQKVLRQMAQAIEHNLSTIYQIQQSLEPYVSPKSLVTIRPNENDNLSGYLKDFRYLKRDWSWQTLSEIQLEKINKSLTQIVVPHLKENENALFIGAGVGRIAFDMADQFKKVYVTDKSFSMAYHFQLLRQKNLDFFEIDDRNLYRPEDSVQKITATLFTDKLQKTVIEDRLNKLEYFISDVTDLPFEDNSVSALFSVYFTDVVALKLWLPEVKRVLKPNGLFIHFGPLDYFFSNINEMFSAKEIMEVFAQNGFTLLEDTMMETMHLPTDRVMVNKLYKNWGFVCRKNESDSEDITENTIIELANNLKYSIHGNIGGSELAYELHVQDGTTYQVNEAIIEILRQMNEGITIKEIVAQIGSKYNSFSEADEKITFDLIILLIKNNVFSIHAKSVS